VIEVKNLTKSFDGNTILQNVSFTVNDGDSLAIIGGSGCGKSTLLRCLNLLTVPDSGEILYNGQNILNKGTDIDGYRRRIGMVYQHFNLFEHLNIMENMILAPMKVLKLSQDEAVARAEALLDRVGMLSRKYRMPSALSGGQKQRVAIARSLMMEPDLMLFDEPTSALDPTMVDEVESVIRKLIQGGMTSVIVTHELRFAEKISNRAIFLAEKGIYEEGSSEQIFASPQRELTKQFIYRSRLFSRELNYRDFDYYSLLSELRAFAAPYGLSPRQSTCLTSCFDELLLPLLENGCGCSLQLVCSESGKGHRLTAEFPTLQSDPFTLPFLDTFSVALLSRYAESLVSEVNAAGHRAVTVTL